MKQVTMKPGSLTGLRDRSRKAFIKTLEGFPSVSDWYRDNNTRLTTVSVTLGRMRIFYSYDLPVAFTHYHPSDPENVILIVLDIPKDSPCRTVTTMKHITRLRSMFPSHSEPQSAEAFVNLFKNSWK